MIKKAIISYADKEYIKILDITSPTFNFYGNKFNYDVHIIDENKLENICKNLNINNYKNRPPSWYKIIIAKYYLMQYDVILWLDADTIITKFNNDIGCVFNKNLQYIQGFVVHVTDSDIRVPNCGVWLLRNSAITLLDHIWDQEDLIHHSWWEQAAMIRLIGWDINLKTNQFNRLSNYGTSSLELPYYFNAHKNDIRFHLIEPQVFHATMFHNRCEVLKEQYEIAKINMLKDNTSLYSTNFEILESRHNLIKYIPSGSDLCIIGTDTDNFIHILSKNINNITITFLDTGIVNNKYFSGMNENSNTNTLSLDYIKKQYKNMKIIDNYNDITNKFDFIYINNFYSYEKCFSDLEFALTKIKPNGGYISGYGYNLFASKAYKTIYYKDMQIFNAVNDFCYKYNFQLSAETMEGYGSFCIRIN